jgi:hypothetical protein
MLRARLFGPSMEQAAKTFALDRALSEGLSDQLSGLQIECCLILCQFFG